MAVDPGVTVAELEVTESEKSGDPPVPESDMVCGLSGALSEIETDAERAPEAAGVKVTPIAQFAPKGRFVPHIFV